MDDQATGNIQEEEVEAWLHGRADRLPAPVPFRNNVAQARLGPSGEAHAEFFREMLADVNEPTALFGFDDVLGDGSRIDEMHGFVEPA